MVSYEGPGLPRQRIPNSALSRLDDPAPGNAGTPAPGSAGISAGVPASMPVSEPRNLNALTLPRSDAPTNFLPGINYRCYEGGWHRLPNFDVLTPVKTGISPNFDLAVITRKEDVGLEFTGFVEAPTSGIYQFFVSSDDGSQLFLRENAPELSIIGSQHLPPPHRLAVGQIFSEVEEQSDWSEIEGEVTFLEQGSQATELELSSSGGHLRIRVVNSSDEPPVYLLHSRIRVAGICRASYTEQGQKVAGLLLVPSWQNIEVLNVAPELGSASKRVSIGE